jgi:hypothetical protein
MKTFALSAMVFFATLQSNAQWDRRDRCEDSGRVPAYGCQQPDRRNRCDLDHRSTEGYYRLRARDEIVLSPYRAKQLTEALYYGVLQRKNPPGQDEINGWTATFSNNGRKQRAEQFLSNISNFLASAEFGEVMRRNSSRSLLDSINQYTDNVLVNHSPRYGYYLTDQALCMIENRREDQLITKAAILTAGIRGRHEYEGVDPY